MKGSWREAALRCLPGQGELIRESESLGDFWMDLGPRFGAPILAPDDGGVREGIWAFARWSILESEDRDIANASYCHFLEHLRAFGPGVQDWIRTGPGRAEVDRLIAAAERLWLGS